MGVLCGDDDRGTVLGLCLRVCILWVLLTWVSCVERYREIRSEAERERGW